jgi:hypothetical protein
MVLIVPIYRCILMGCEAVCQSYYLQDMTQERYHTMAFCTRSSSFIFMEQNENSLNNLYDVLEVVYRLKHEETGLVRTEQVKIIYGST